MKKIKLSFSLAILSIFVFSSCLDSSQPKDDKEIPIIEYGYSSEILEVLEKKAHLLEKLVTDTVILDVLGKKNKENITLKHKTILERDKRWRSTLDRDKLFKEIIATPCSKTLIDFKNKYGFEELIITDKRGLNVCISNRTTYYYQADEKWWINSFDEGKGKLFFGFIEYDESVHTDAIPIFLPIYDEGKNVTGLLKTILSINRIKMDI